MKNNITVLKKMKAQLLFQLSEHSKNRATLLCPFLLWFISHNVCTDCRISDNSGSFVFLFSLSFFLFTTSLRYFFFLQTVCREFNHLTFILEFFVSDQKDERQTAHAKAVKPLVETSVCLHVRADKRCDVCELKKNVLLLTSSSLAEKDFLKFPYFSFHYSRFCVSSAAAILRAVLIVSLLFDLLHLKRSLVNLMDRRVSFSKFCWVLKISDSNHTSLIWKQE